MAGRGRGRGPALSFDLQALGINKGDLNENVVEPPPLYPPLRVKPMQPLDTEQVRYMVKIKERMRKWNHENIRIDIPEINPIEKYSNKYKAQKKSEYEEIDPSYFPAELFEDDEDDERRRKRRNAKKIPPKIPVRKKAKGGVDDIKILNDSKEVDEDEPAETNKPDGDKGNKSDDERSESENEVELDSEEEIEETDYAENYFDNGENYLDEDDNLDDD